MKTMTLIAIAAAGGLLYLNKRRGGDLSVDSLRSTARDLFGNAADRVREMKGRVDQEIAQP